MGRAADAMAHCGECEGSDARCPRPEGVTTLRRVVTGASRELAALTDDPDELVRVCTSRLEATDEQGRTALVFAGRRGLAEAVRRLLDLGADPTAQDDDGMKVLIGAAGDGHTGVVESLLASGRFEVNATGSYRLTALLWAAARDQAGVVRLLLDLGADPTVRGSFSRTVAMAAMAGIGGAALLDAMASRGACGDLSAEDAYGQTALALATKRLHGLPRDHEAGPRYAEAVARLVELGADPADCTLTGATALHAAAVAGSVRVAEAVAASALPANIEARDRAGHTALLRAAEKGHADAVRLLLELDADAAATDAESRAPLSLAARAGHAEAVRALIAAGSEGCLEARCMRKRTALWCAVEAGRAAVAGLLLAAGADPLGGETHWSPLLAAARTGSIALMDALDSEGATGAHARGPGPPRRDATARSSDARPLRGGAEAPPGRGRHGGPHGERQDASGGSCRPRAARGGPAPGREGCGG